MAGAFARARWETCLPEDTASSWSVILIIIVAGIAFVVMWVSICHLLSSLGGWRRLARLYPAGPAGHVVTHRWQSGQFGFVTYRRCLNVQVTSEGLRIEALPLFWPGHAPLFLPWSEIQGAHIERWLIIDFVAFDVGAPRQATVRLPAGLFADEAVPRDLLTGPSKPASASGR